MKKSTQAPTDAGKHWDIITDAIGDANELPDEDYVQLLDRVAHYAASAAITYREQIRMNNK